MNKNNKTTSTKTALILSVLALLLCCSMLIGTTFAWFTDSVTSSGNVIQTGTLRIALEKWDNVNSKWVDASNAPIFNYDRWEPGYTEVANLRVVNLGTLALKWQATITTENELSILADVINVYVRSDDQNDTVKDYITNITDRSQFEALAAEGQFEKFTLREFVESLTVMTKGTLVPEQKSYLSIVLQMDTDAGNEYQGLDLDGKFDLKILATQYTYEKDSFDDQYDVNADGTTIHKIYNNDDLYKAFAEGGIGRIENMNLTDVKAELNKNKSLTLNTNNSTISGTDDEYVIVNRGDLSITGDGTIVNNMKGSIENWGNLYINNINIDVKGSKYGFHVKAGEVEINDLTLTAQRGGLNIQGGKVIINSGSITTTAYSTNIGYLVYAAGTSEVVINGGDFRYEGAYNRHGVLYAGNNASIVVNGGTFGKGGSNTAKKPWLQTGDNGTITLCGGSYQFDPTQYLSESITIGDGYEVVKGADGWWTGSKIAG